MTAPRRLVGPNLYIFFKPTPNKVGKIDFLLSKKITPKAVDRNLIRRRLKGVLREVKFKPSAQEVKIGSKVNLITIPYQQIKTELLSLLNKIQ